MSEIFSYCPLCGQDLVDKERITRWVHDIINHRGYWEAQNQDADKDDVMSLLYEIIEHFHGKSKGKDIL